MVKTRNYIECDSSKEIWKKVHGLRHYEVSNFGNIRNTDNGGYVTQYKVNDNSTWYVTLSNKSIRNTMTVAKVVMMSFNDFFYENVEHYRVIFKDKDRDNCALDNLDIISKKYKYRPIVPIEYRNDIWMWIVTEDNLLKAKRKIAQVKSTNGSVLYESVYVADVVKQSKNTYELWCYEVKDNKQSNHTTIEADFSNDENKINNTFNRQ